jgi:Tfp pilus assembly protein PilX
MANRKLGSRGFALIAALLLLVIISGISIGMLLMVNTEQRVNTQDVQANISFHAAEGAIENMTANLSELFHNLQSPSVAQIEALSALAPQNTAFVSYPLYTLTPATNATGGLATQWGTIPTGSYAGLYAQLAPITLQVIAQGPLGDETDMSRQVDVALIPVFQFGLFSDSDLSFFAGPNFSFAGPVHTNGDLYLAEGDGNTLTFHSMISAYGNVIREQLANGASLASNSSTGTVLIPTATSGCDGTQPHCRSFTASPNDGSVVAGPASAYNAGPPSWQTISLTNYGGKWIIDGDYGNTQYGTGATNLSLPFVNGTTTNTTGPQQFEIIRRPPAGEPTTSPLGSARLYNLAQIRVFLSDDPNELPCGNPSAAPPCGGASDSQNIRLANFKDPDNGVDYSHGVPQTGMATLSDGGSQTLYFATANSAVANPSSGFYEYPSATQVSTDWEFGPLYPLPASINTIHDPLNNPSQAPYMLVDTSTNSAAVDKTPPPDYLVLCNPSTSGSYTTEPYCPGTGSYPYYSLVSPVTGTSGSPALTLPFGYQSSAAGASVVTVSNAAQSAWNLLDGYLRVDYQDANGNYHPVTQEWLQLGFARGLQPPTTPGTNTINPNAILIFQQPADRNANGVLDSTGAPPSVTKGSCSGSSCKYTVTPGKPPKLTADSSTGSPWFGDSKQAAGQQSPSQYNWYPINFYDDREGEVRDVATGNDSCTPNGVMSAVELDVGNLKQWLAGKTGASGTSVNSQYEHGYVLYFSDRRGMLPNPHGTQVDPANTKTGDSGLEDDINSSSATGTPNGTLEPDPANKNFSPEDVNLNGMLDNFGAANLGLGLGYNLTVPTSPVTTFTVAHQINKVVNGTAVPDPYMVGTSRISSCAVAQNNWVSGARHVLKLVDGALGNLPLTPASTGGFTVGSENPVYVLGNYNSNSTDPTWTGGADAAGMAAASIVADSVILLSNNWSDWNSILSGPTNLGNRAGSTTYYRVAVAAGKNINFPYPSACTSSTCNADFGTDGGVHNFLRYLEDWSCCTLNYKGSIASLYYATYNTGIYKCCNTVYSPPTRNYSFDIDFETPSGLPPGTPMFRDIDNLSFTQNFTPHTGSY